jgi:hypothetical protein
MLHTLTMLAYVGTPGVFCCSSEDMMLCNEFVTFLKEEEEAVQSKHKSKLGYAVLIPG